MTRPRILVVDDEPGVRFALRDFLSHRGFDVEEAATCGEAESRYRRDVYDAVTLDYAMPDGNALELLPRLKGIDAGVPIVLVTA
jgi:DNA-binding response OmpR family regulator